MEPRKRGPRPEFKRHISLYENDEGADLLAQLAEKRGLSQAGVLRDLIRQAAKQQGIQPG